MISSRSFVESHVSHSSPSADSCDIVVRMRFRWISFIFAKSRLFLVCLLTLFGRRVAFGIGPSVSVRLESSPFNSRRPLSVAKSYAAMMGNRNYSFVEPSSAGRSSKEVVSDSSIAVLPWLLLFTLKFNASHVDDYHAQTLRRLGASTSPDHRPGSHFG